jgi:hypothetical protein
MEHTTDRPATTQVRGRRAGVTERPPTRTSAEQALLWLEGLLALGAYGGAIGLITGSVDLGGATADLPFGSTTLAGISLGLVNGLLPTVVLFGALRHAPWSRTGHWLVGVALTAWIVVQVGFLGWPPHWLQILYFCYGLAILALARRMNRGDPARVEAS